MKYVILLGDGMADYEIPDLGGKTPLEYADTPNMDFLASQGEIGMARTVPEGFPPGSDVANLSVMGYDPRKYYTGRSPLEAVSMGVKLGNNDAAFRCNLVTLSENDDYKNKIMVDYSADEITTAESSELIKKINVDLGTDVLNFHAGFGFRHLLTWRGGPTGGKLTPPHDISGKSIKGHLPDGEGSDTLGHLMRESYDILHNHQVNRKRKESGLRPANSIWFWGQGKKPAIEKFHNKYGLSGSVVSAVDLIKGIGICAGLDVVKVENVTGTIHTNYRGKVHAALDELKSGKDFVYVHVEAPDAAAHRGEIDTKVAAIEMVDQVLGQLLDGLKAFNSYKIMLLPDHRTPLSTMTHSSEPVPFAIFKCCSQNNGKVSGRLYSEKSAAYSGFMIQEGHRLMDYFIRGSLPVTGV